MIDGFRQIRETIKLHNSISKNKDPDDNYRLDRYNVNSYFDIHEKWRDKICSYFHELHDAGEKVVHVDICGRATARSLGADISYCFSFKTPLFRSILEPNNVFIDGNIFNTSDFSSLINRLRKDNARPALVTFEPVAGLQDYHLLAEHVPDYMKITYGQLEKRLTDMIGILRPGGYIYLERPFQFGTLADSFLRKDQKDYEISLSLKKISRLEKCRIEISSVIGGPYFLINKNDKH